jgi:hypothetical protein
MELKPDRAMPPPEYASAEQRLYAQWMDYGTRAGFVVLVVTFLAYVFELVPAAIDLHALPRYWGLPVHEYVAATGAPTGWGWVAQLGSGDYLNFLGVALLGAVTIVCYLRLLPALIRSGDRAFAVICALEIVVLAIAAAGWVGGH